MTIPHPSIMKPLLTQKLSTYLGNLLSGTPYPLRNLPYKDPLHILHTKNQGFLWVSALQEPHSYHKPHSYLVTIHTPECSESLHLPRNHFTSLASFLGTLCPLRNLTNKDLLHNFLRTKCCYRYLPQTTLGTFSSSVPQKTMLSLEAHFHPGTL